MSKRKYNDYDGEHDDGYVDLADLKERVNDDSLKLKKHTLDSDEEDSGDDEKYNVMNENDIEGEENGEARMDDDIKITPFNMLEELEEGHFDKEGHFQWDKKKEIKDSWLENIDWIKIQPNKAIPEGDDSSIDSIEALKKFDLIGKYKEIITYMIPGETIKKTLQRLGKSTQKLSSVERWRRKKEGIRDEASDKVTRLTEICNEILTNTGNMDIYEEKYERILNKTQQSSSNGGAQVNSGSKPDDLDMYADDFDLKEKSKLGISKNDDDDDNKAESKSVEIAPEVDVPLTWEFKWKDSDEEIHGPFGTEQMQMWVDEGYFADGVFVRKSGAEDQKFYSSKRIDFELYL